MALPNADSAGAVWSRDGERLAYTRQGRDKDDGIYVQRADGSGPAQEILESDGPDVFFSPQSWVPDGSGLIIDKRSGGNTDILFVNVPPDGKPATTRALRATLAFFSDETGKTEVYVYVAPYNADGTLGMAFAVSGDNVQLPAYGRLAWAVDDRLFFDSMRSNVMSVRVTTKSGITASPAVVAYDLKKVRAFTWDILPDGRLLIIRRGDGEDDLTQYNIVLNWFAELREKTATGRR